MVLPLVPLLGDPDNSCCTSRALRFFRFRRGDVKPTTHKTRTAARSSVNAATGWWDGRPGQAIAADGIGWRRWKSFIGLQWDSVGSIKTGGRTTGRGTRSWVAVGRSLRRMVSTSWRWTSTGDRMRYWRWQGRTCLCAVIEQTLIEVFGFCRNKGGLELDSELSGIQVWHWNPSSSLAHSIVADSIRHLFVNTKHPHASDYRSGHCQCKMLVLK